MQQLERQPLVSILMPVYNAQLYLAEAIESILRQTYDNWELIIVDDASTDRSWRIIQKYRLKARGRILAYRLKANQNAGGDTAANIAFSYANGDYIARMDADDISLPRRLETQIRFLQKYPDITLVGSSAVVIDQQGKRIGRKSMPLVHAAIAREYFHFHPIINPTVMINRALFPYESAIYEMRHSSNNDYYTFFKLLCDGHRFANIKTPLLHYRIHSTNDSLANVKRSYRNTLRTRIEMVYSHGYRPTVCSWLLTGVQSIVIGILPEPVLFQLYLYMRGIKKLPRAVRIRQNLTSGWELLTAGLRSLQLKSRRWMVTAPFER